MVYYEHVMDSYVVQCTYIQVFQILKKTEKIKYDWGKCKSEPGRHYKVLPQKYKNGNTFEISLSAHYLRMDKTDLTMVFYKMEA